MQPEVPSPSPMPLTPPLQSSPPGVPNNNFPTNGGFSGGDYESDSNSENDWWHQPGPSGAVAEGFNGQSESQNAQHSSGGWNSNPIGANVMNGSNMTPGGMGQFQTGPLPDPVGSFPGSGFGGAGGGGAGFAAGQVW